MPLKHCVYYVGLQMKLKKEIKNQDEVRFIATP